MNIYINSKMILIDASISLLEVLDNNGYTSGNFAIAVNRVFVPRGQYANTQMSDGDEIEVVVPMQGG